jgi:hypothetical protein
MAAWHGSPAADGNGNAHSNGMWYFQPGSDQEQQNGAATTGYAPNGQASNGYGQQYQDVAQLPSPNGFGGVRQYPQPATAPGYQQAPAAPPTAAPQPAQPGMPSQNGQPLQNGQPPQNGQLPQNGQVLQSAQGPAFVAPLAPPAAPAPAVSPAPLTPPAPLPTPAVPQAPAPASLGAPAVSPGSPAVPQNAQTGPIAAPSAIPTATAAAPPVAPREQTMPQPAAAPAAAPSPPPAAAPPAAGTTGPLPSPSAPQADQGSHAGAATPGPLSKITGVVRGRRAARKPRLSMSAIFADLVDMADIPRSGYAVDEEVPGAMCLFKTDGGYEVFSCGEDARTEVRFFEEEEAAYFYLFGVLAAEALRSGRLSPRRN